MTSPRNTNSREAAGPRSTASASMRAEGLGNEHSSPDFAALFSDGAAFFAGLPRVLWTVALLWWRS